MIYKRLANLDFASILFESKTQTQSGSNFINKYQVYVMANPVTCSLVNNFVKEAQQFSYDNGVVAVSKKVCDYIAESKYSWLLASACEQINEQHSSYNYLNLNAAKQVEKLLETEEKDVVNYIKAGALKNVMFVENFRNIVKSVQQDIPVVEEYAEYTITHPISLVEKHDENVYFTVMGQLYSINEQHEVRQHNVNEWNVVSNDFRTITNLLESNLINYNNDTFSYNCNNKFTYSVSEAGKCVKEQNGKNVTLTVEQMRENNNLYIMSLPNSAQKQRTAQVLEGMAKLCENYNNIALLNNVHIVESKNDKILLIESTENSWATLLKTNHSAQWSITKNIYEVCNFIKQKANIDLTQVFEEKIEQAIEKTEGEEKEKIQESIKQDEITARKRKIEQLTEKYKNDPTRLAVLSKIAQELSRIDK